MRKNEGKQCFARLQQGTMEHRFRERAGSNESVTEHY